MEVNQENAGKPEEKNGSFASDDQNIFPRPYTDQQFGSNACRNYTIAVIQKGTPDEEDECMEDLLLGAMEAGDEAILVTSRPLTSDVVLWYKTGCRVQVISQLLSGSSLAMSSFNYPRSALALAVGGFVVWGAHSLVWNRDVTSKYQLHPDSGRKGASSGLKDKALLFRRERNDRSHKINMSTILIACGLATSIFLWARHKF